MELKDFENDTEELVAQAFQALANEGAQQAREVLYQDLALKDRRGRLLMTIHFVRRLFEMHNFGKYAVELTAKFADPYLGEGATAKNLESRNTFSGLFRPLRPTTPWSNVHPKNAYARMFKWKDYTPWAAVVTAWCCRGGRSGLAKELSEIAFLQWKRSPLAERPLKKAEQRISKRAERLRAAQTPAEEPPNVVPLRPAKLEYPSQP